MSDHSDSRPYGPRETAVPPFETDGRCWYRFFALNALFQRFIVFDLARYDTASCVIDREVYVAMELLNFHSAEDTDWLHGHGQPVAEPIPYVASAAAPLPNSSLDRWWPLAKLEAGFIRFLFTELDTNPRQMKVIDGKLYVTRDLVAAYAAGDTDWLWGEASCDPVSTMYL